MCGTNRFEAIMLNYSIPQCSKIVPIILTCMTNYSQFVPQKLNHNADLKFPRRAAVDIDATTTLYLCKCSATTEVVLVKTVPLMVYTALWL